MGHSYLLEHIWFEVGNIVRVLQYKSNKQKQNENKVKILIC